MSCASGCIRWMLFLFNFLFALGGLALLVLGVVIQLGLKGVIKMDIDVHVSYPTAVIIAIGAVIFIIAFFGCCGAIRESHCMIVTFAILLLTLLVVQVAMAVYAFMTLKDADLKTKMNKGIQQAVADYYHDKNLREAVNSVQSLASCCGYNGYLDYVQNSENPDRSTVPYSCCGNNEDKPCSVTDISGAARRPGCGEVVYPKIEKYAQILGGLALGIAAVELVGVIFSFCLANSIRNVERRGYKV